MFKRRLSLSEKISFFRFLGSFLSTGMGLAFAIEQIVGYFPEKHVRKQVMEIHKRIINGESLADAMMKSAGFRNFELACVRISEETASLVNTLHSIAMYYQFRQKVAKNLVAAMGYPLLLVIATIGAVFFMLEFVVPVFAKIFISNGMKLPWITRVVIGFSGKFPELLLLFLFVAAIFLCIGLIIRKNIRYRILTGMILTKLPVFRRFYCVNVLFKICLAMELMLHAKITLSDSLNTLRYISGNDYLIHVFDQVRKDIINGHTLGASVSRHSFFKGRFASLIIVGEESNRLGYFFGKLKEEYEENLRNTSALLQNIAEPALVLLISSIMAVILVSMYLPLFRIGTLFGNF